MAVVAVGAPWPLTPRRAAWWARAMPPGARPVGGVLWGASGRRLEHRRTAGERGAGRLMPYLLGPTSAALGGWMIPEFARNIDPKALSCPGRTMSADAFTSDSTVPLTIKHRTPFFDCILW